MNSTELIELSDNVKKATDAFYDAAAEKINSILLVKGTKLQDEYVIDMKDSGVNVYADRGGVPDEEYSDCVWKVSSRGSPASVCITAEWGDYDPIDLLRSSIIDIVQNLEQFSPKLI